SARTQPTGPAPQMRRSTSSSMGVPLLGFWRDAAYPGGAVILSRPIISCQCHSLPRFADFGLRSQAAPHTSPYLAARRSGSRQRVAIALGQVAQLATESSGGDVLKQVFWLAIHAAVDLAGGQQLLVVAAPAQVVEELVSDRLHLTEEIGFAGGALFNHAIPV